MGTGKNTQEGVSGLSREKNCGDPEPLCGAGQKSESQLQPLLGTECTKALIGVVVYINDIKFLISLIYLFYLSKIDLEKVFYFVKYFLKN